MRENLSSGLANTKGADQPVHTHSLITAFVTFFIRELERMLSRPDSSKISHFYQVPVAEQTGLSLA